MQYVIDELKQFIVKKVKYIEKKDTLWSYYNLIKNKKYLIFYSDQINDNDEINYHNVKIIEYMGNFSHFTHCKPGSYGDLLEGYYFYGINKSHIDKNTTTYYATGELNRNYFEDNFDLIHTFYELEDTFTEKNMLETFTHIIKNNEINKINSTIKIISNSCSIKICKNYIYSEHNDICSEGNIII